MMFEVALRARLLRADAVRAICGDRVSWQLRPEGGALPAITLSTISDVRPRHLKGRDGARSTLVQVDCWATSYGAAHALAMAAIGAIEPPAMIEGKRFGSASIAGPRDLSEELKTGTTIYRLSVDCSIWHVGE